MKDTEPFNDEPKIECPSPAGRRGSKNFRLAIMEEDDKNLEKTTGKVHLTVVRVLNCNLITNFDRS